MLAAYSFDEKKLRAFIGFYNELMLEESPLSKLEREMIAVVVSAANRCYYCQVAHGQAVRELSGDPALGELLVMNYRAAMLTRAARDARLRAQDDRDSRGDCRGGSRGAAQCGFRRARDLGHRRGRGILQHDEPHGDAVDMMPNVEYHAKSR